MRQTAKSIWEELVLFIGITALMVFLLAAGIYWFEHEQQPEEFASVFHGLWWAVVTLTTVGYGDIYPVTVGGRLFTALVMLLGIGLVAVTTGLFASALTRIREAGAQAEDAGENNET